MKFVRVQVKFSAWFQWRSDQKTGTAPPQWLDLVELVAWQVSGL